MGASPTPRRADAIAVAVSGGRDSIALLHATLRAARPLGITVHALHVHHGLVAQADAWAAQVRAQCRRWGAAFHLTRLTGAPAPAESVEAWARRERYAALATMAQAAGCRAVLLAHHRRDQAETVLLQLMRGAGARGLAAMPAAVQRAGIIWLRPWRDHPRSAIEAYVKRHRLSWVDDASNHDPRFARNRLRQQVWPLLDAAFPAAEAALAGAAQRAADEAQALRELAEADAALACADGTLAVTAWRALSPARRMLLLRHLIEAWSGRGVPQTLVRRLGDELQRCPSGQWPAPGGTLRLRRGRLAWVGASGPGQASD